MPDFNINFSDFICRLTSNLKNIDKPEISRIKKAGKIADEIIQSACNHPIFERKLTKKDVIQLKNAWDTYKKDNYPELKIKISKIVDTFFVDEGFQEERQRLLINEIEHLDFEGQLIESFFSENIDMDFLLQALQLLVEKNPVMAFAVAKITLATEHRREFYSIIRLIAKKEPLVMAKFLLFYQGDLGKNIFLSQDEMINLVLIIIEQDPCIFYVFVPSSPENTLQEEIYKHFIKRLLPSYITPEEFIKTCGKVNLRSLVLSERVFESEEINEVLHDGICLGTALAYIESDVKGISFSEKRARFLQAAHMVESRYSRIPVQEKYFFELGKVVNESLTPSSLMFYIFFDEIEDIIKNTTYKDDCYIEIGKLAYSLFFHMSRYFEENENFRKDAIFQALKNIKKHEMVPVAILKKINVRIEDRSGYLEKTKDLYVFLLKQMKYKKSDSYIVSLLFKKGPGHALYFSFNPPRFVDSNDYDNEAKRPKIHKFSSPEEAIQMFLLYIEMNYKDNLDRITVDGYSKINA